MTKTMTKTVFGPKHTRELFFSEDRHRLMQDVVIPGFRRIVEAYDVDAVVVSGHSGLIPGVGVADALGLDLVAVRKRSDSTHYDLDKINGTVKSGCRYVILDDLIDSGSTITHILSQMNVRKDSVCVGVALYGPKYHVLPIPSPDMYHCVVKSPQLLFMLKCVANVDDETWQQAVSSNPGPR